MLNAEKYKHQITEMKYRFGINKEKGNLMVCGFSQCPYCKFRCEYIMTCDKQKIKWLLEETDPKGEEETIKIDWTKIPVDTKVLASYDEKKWFNCHFAKFEKGIVYVWSMGCTSHTASGQCRYTTYPYTKLMEED